MVDRGSLRRSFLTTSIGVRFPPPRRWRMQRHDHVSSNPPRRSSRYQARKPARAQLALCRRAEHAVGGHQVFPGIRIKVLYSDDSGITTALFKLDPGAVVPLHEHVALEQTYVIEGTLEDHEGVCGPGQFVWRPPGNQHEAVAPNGAVILGFFLKPNRFAYGEEFFTAAR
jgi:quercetin dioxygenase-like cupin family protein